MPHVTTVLHGSSWAHARGHEALLAAGMRFGAERGIEVRWTPRTLSEFGMMDVGQLAEHFDLVAIDHPHVGSVAASRCLVALDEVLGARRIDSLGDRSPGRSHQSYAYDGHQWALAIDAACQVAAWRADGLGGVLPRTWADTAVMAREGAVIWPLSPVDAQASFLSLAAALGPPVGSAGAHFVAPAGGVAALEAMHAVARHLDPRCFELDAVGALEALAADEGDAAYCPLVFGYVNYARDGFRDLRLCFGDAPTVREEGSGLLLGGVGLGVSVSSANVAAAADFVLWIASPEVQCSTFFDSGGQPAHIAAWEDAALDVRAGRFFSRTRNALERAWMRPRTPGFVSWQNASLAVVHDALQAGSGFDRAVAELNELARMKVHAS